MVGSPPANAGDTGSSPGLGRSHMPRSNWACEPQLLSLRVWNLCSAAGEAAIVRGPRTAMKSSPRLPQLEKACAQQRRPHAAKEEKKSAQRRQKPIQNSTLVKTSVKNESEIKIFSDKRKLKKKKKIIKTKQNKTLVLHSIRGEKHCLRGYSVCWL